jgi:hypothetical protein
MGILIVALNLTPVTVAHEKVGHSHMFESASSDLKIKNFLVANAFCQISRVRMFSQRPVIKAESGISLFI